MKIVLIGANGKIAELVQTAMAGVEVCRKLHETAGMPGALIVI